MELRDALRTTGAVREFDGSPVDRATVYDLLETARFAPSGGNRQGWRVVLVEDRARRRALRDLYLTGWYEYLAIAQAGLVPFAPITDRVAEDAARRDAPAVAAAAREAAPGFAERLDEVPVLLVLLADLRALAAIDRDEEGYSFVGGASLYPFAWSILLAAHDAGLGGVLTTVARRRQADVLELLNVTDANLSLAGVLALGRPTTRATRLRRQAVEAFATIDGVDGPPLSR
jgi:nitroreductase